MNVRRRLFWNFDHDGLAGRKEQLLKKYFCVQLGEATARIEDDLTSGVDATDGLQRFRT